MKIYWKAGIRKKDTGRAVENVWKVFWKRRKHVEKFYELVIRHRKIIFAVFIGIAVICAMAQKFVSVNYDMNSYLPEDSPSTVALDVMEDEFDGGIPNARVLIYNVTVPEALSYKEKLGEIDGVTDVTWLDDAVTEKQVQILKKTSSIRNSFF